jgi:hypothetical protein
MESFPTELLDLILHYLNVRSLIAMSETCKRNRSIVQNICANTLISIVITVAKPGSISSRWIILCGDPIVPGGGNDPSEIVPITHTYYLTTINTFIKLIKVSHHGYVEWAYSCDEDFKIYSEYIFPVFNRHTSLSVSDYQKTSISINYRIDNVNYPTTAPTDDITMVDRVATDTKLFVRPAKILRCRRCGGDVCHYPTLYDNDYSRNPTSVVCAKCIHILT